LYDERICRDRQRFVMILADPCRRRARAAGHGVADGRKSGKNVIAAITGSGDDEAMPARTVLIASAAASGRGTRLTAGLAADGRARG
jgi:hypothetical protein